MSETQCEHRSMLSNGDGVFCADCGSYRRMYVDGGGEWFNPLAVRDEAYDLRRWKDAVEEAGAVNWTLTAQNRGDPRKVIADLLHAQRVMFEDPAVSKIAARAARADDLARLVGQLAAELALYCEAGMDADTDALLAAAAKVEQPAPNRTEGVGPQ